MTNANDTPFNHGTTTGYSRYGCRCGECREAERLNKAQYRQRHRARSSSAAAEYDRRNKDRIAARRAAERAADPVKFRIRFAEYAKANPDVRHLSKLRRRAREVGGDNRLINVTDWRRLCRPLPTLLRLLRRAATTYSGSRDPTVPRRKKRHRKPRPRMRAVQLLEGRQARRGVAASAEETIHPHSMKEVYQCLAHT